MNYRKRPVVIQAFQYDGDLQDRNGTWVSEFAKEAYKAGILYYASISDDTPPCELFVKTLEGDMHVSVGDYVIEGISGELYPCKPDIFLKSYEEVS